MENTITNNIFLVWFGNSIPSYIDFTINQYKKLNQNFNVKFIHYNKDEIFLINDEELNKCKYYLECFINNQNTIYTDYIQYRIDNMFTYIQILSDIYRIEILKKFGGIYVDVDTLPIKPFNDLLSEEQYAQQILDVQFLESTKNFKNRKTPNISALNDMSDKKIIIYDDNYFIATKPGNNKNIIISPYFKIINKKDNICWIKNFETSPFFKKYRDKFYQLSLTENDIEILRSRYYPYYILHFFHQNWNTATIQENSLFSHKDYDLYPNLLKNNSKNISFKNGKFIISCDKKVYQSSINKNFMNQSQTEYAPDVIFSNGINMISYPTDDDYKNNGYIKNTNTSFSTIEENIQNTIDKIDNKELC